MTFRPKLNLLIAYPYLKKEYLSDMEGLVKEGKCRFLLDSGAFTCNSLGIKITVDDYCRFIDSLPWKPWRYFMLDVIGDPEATRRNYEIMLERGYDPIPIFTQGDSYDSLEYFYSKSDLVGIGGLVIPEKKRVQAFISETMHHINGRKCHWLGITDDNMVKYFRPYSCDSSTSSRGERFGELMLYAGGSKYTYISRKEFFNKPNEEALRIIRRFGFNPKDFAQQKNWINSSKESNLHIKFNCVTYTAKNLDYERCLGTKMFSVVSNRTQVVACIEAFKRLEKMKLYQ